MNKQQRSIKTFAIALATMLAVIIIGVIILGVSSIASWFKASSGRNFSDGTNYSNNFNTDDLTNITINNSCGKLIIKRGDNFEVTGENVLENFSCELENETLVIEHSSGKFLNFTDYPKTSITVTIPEDVKLDALEISTGVDNCSINDIEVSEFVLNAGVGEVTISNLTSDNVHIECGVGNTFISGKLGNCTIASGVGEVQLEIDGDFEDYDIALSAGIGNMHIDGERYKNDARLNKGAKNKLEIDGGVGNISVNFN